MARRRESGAGPHDDSMLMIPPPGFKFIPRYETVCGKPGCFECFDIYCERCESKDRRIIELEMRNNDLAKYITQLQARVFGPSKLTAAQAQGPALKSPHFTQQQQPLNPQHHVQANGGDMRQTAPLGTSAVYPQPGSQEPFAYIQSPVLFDPTLNLSYVATTSFAPAKP
ncbi:uncharacterized protein LOC34621563 [Cyclospora cayetanensis]|uniref:Uncharacterized protein LOC34621563 n=1 Tax=Cyclospora cayetanensis TaxID=88456 RepID=A0A6P6S273_9EIME|nr:uncharacterized protein LOC34621563 [Cyclospora cayetanensis]